MALSGFEGFEKRIELHFLGEDSLSLRRLPISTLNQILSAVQCTIVSAVGNRFFDSYILSESSLFMFPHKIIIKTCGTTQLLKSIPLLLPVASSVLGLSLSFCRYSRGSFIFPDAQPFPHSCFHDEVAYLDRVLPSGLCHRKACILPSNTHHSWHVYSASASAADADADEMTDFNELTLEVCMTDLDRQLADGFYRDKSDIELSGDEAGRRMTKATGINAINPRSLTCGFAFDPCGYSMNGLDVDSYSTIHVTPEDGYSYASFECAAKSWVSIVDALPKAVRVFGPQTVSVSVCGGGPSSKETLCAIDRTMESLGMKSKSCALEDFPGEGLITYQTFSL